MSKKRKKGQTSDGRPAADPTRDERWMVGLEDMIIDLLADQTPLDEIVKNVFARARQDGRNEDAFELELGSLAAVLEVRRLTASGGDAAARAALEEARRAVEAEVAKGGVEAGVLMLIGRAFAQAGLEAPTALAAGITDIMEAMDAEGASENFDAAIQSLLADFAEMAQGLENDPFAVYAELSTLGAAMSGAMRAQMAATLLWGDEPALREAAIGFLLDRDEACAVRAAEIVRQERKPVSSVMVERMVRMRPWLAGIRRDAADATIRKLRAKAEAPVARAQLELDHCAASLVDGVGAQSLHAVAREGNHFTFISVLIKQGEGVVDALAHGGLRRKEITHMLDELGAGVQAVKVPLAFWRRRLCDALARNLQGAPPPFGLVQVAELLGLPALPPEPVDAAALAEELLAGLPSDRTGAQALDAAFDAAAQWDERISAAESWFEANEEVETLLAREKTRKARFSALCVDYLPPRRAIWAQRLAWTAACLEHQEGAPIDDWTDMALIARELSAGRAAPFLELLAEKTLEEFA